MEGRQLEEQIEEVYESVIKWRRYLHQHPELSFQEVNTSQFIFDTLSNFENLELSRPTKTSVVARLKGTKPGKRVALRADIDALPIKEETGLPFASKNNGVMHACGHDGHTAMLLGAAKVLSESIDELSGEIIFIFQHAEEVPPGGAQELVKAGVVNGIDKIIGMHLMPAIPLGKIGITLGASTTASDLFDIIVQGKAGHASSPQDSIDSLAIGAQIVSSLHHIVSRDISPLESSVISVTRFHSGDAYNVIPGTATIGGSVRSFSEEVREKLRQRIEEVAQGVATAYGAKITFQYMYGYSAVVNDETVTKELLAVIKKQFPDNCIEFLPPMLGGEDFSAFSNEIPGCYIRLGAGNVDKGIIHPLHHPSFNIEELALKYGVKIYVNAALSLTKS
ncbi:amidohydrolase [Bacillus aquiflavi]|uniref:Amidohydrolase n=1 Tax=Bacillus aquiflavi TaxID=2672567 RepID=A0A6B3VWW1_9BACI|nr:amidohydrolase [Bacillus aquiflavi]MBA4535620.1 amidohydrolase [Bacillus aquiflavi]NEY79996.1 amidohydrolase [Bacillus aquiflavi]UAC48936.1 amidohydrolase [Bacillus aquiflavi]